MPEKMITIREKKPVLCCTHCGRHPAQAVGLSGLTSEGHPASGDIKVIADLCADCIKRLVKLTQPIVPRPRAPKPAAAPKPKRGRPRKKAKALAAPEVDQIKAEIN